METRLMMLIVAAAPWKSTCCLNILVKLVKFCQHCQNSVKHSFKSMRLIAFTSLSHCRTVELMLPAEHNEDTASLPPALHWWAPALTCNNIKFVCIDGGRFVCWSDQWSISVKSNYNRFLLHVRPVSQCSTTATLFFSTDLSLISHLSSLVCVRLNLKHTHIHTHTHHDEQDHRGQPALMKSKSMAELTLKAALKKSCLRENRKSFTVTVVFLYLAVCFVYLSHILLKTCY